MPKSIAELLDSELELGTEKTAAEQTSVSEIEKLATDLGLLDETEDNQSQQQEGHNKEASMSMEQLLGVMFPSEAGEVAQEQEKIAHESEETLTKEAALQEAEGMFAHDCFVQHVEDGLYKIAAELVEAVAAGDAHPQQLEDDEVTDGEAIDTTPQVQDKAMKPNHEGEVGHVEIVKSAALRKAMLLASLEE